MAFGGYLQANTAVTVMIGPFVDEDDGKTAETGLTISQADVRLSKNGGNMAQKNNATACTHDEIGIYSCPLSTTDTNTEGILTLCVHESGALPVKMDYQVLAQAAYASLVTAKDSGYMDVNVKAVSEDTTAADNLESACDNYSATRGLAGTALPAAAADAAGGLPISDAGGLDLDTKLANTNEVTAARMGALTDWINGGRLDLILDELTAQGDTNEGKLDTIDTVVDAVKAKTDNLPADPADDSDIDAQLAAIAAYLDTEIASILEDTNELQTDLANGGRLDLILDELTTQGDTNETKIDTLDTVADAIKVVTDLLAASASTIVSGTVSHDNTAATTTVFYSDDITEATADHFKGRVVIFTSDVLQYQATDITAYELESGEGKFTVTRLTEAPPDNCTFVIV